MKNLIIFLFVLFPLITFSQSDEKLRKFSVGLNFSPDYCYRIINGTDYEVAMRNSEEIPKFGYTTGFNLAWQFHERFSLESGLLFSDKGEIINRKEIYTYKGGNSVPTLNAYLTANNHYYFLDIPLKLNFFVLTGKTKIYLTLGASINKYHSDKIIGKIEYLDGRKETYNSTLYDQPLVAHFAIIGGLGISQNFNERFILRFEPVYRRSLQSFTEYSPSHYLYSYGANLGLSYKL